jgi:hypothetical protein
MMVKSSVCRQQSCETVCNPGLSLITYPPFFSLTYESAQSKVLNLQSQSDPTTIYLLLYSIRQVFNENVLIVLGQIELSLNEFKSRYSDEEQSILSDEFESQYSEEEEELEHVLEDEEELEDGFLHLKYLSLLHGLDILLV